MPDGKRPGRLVLHKRLKIGYARPPAQAAREQDDLFAVGLRNGIFYARILIGSAAVRRHSLITVFFGNEAYPVLFLRTRRRRYGNVGIILQSCARREV